MPTLLFFGLPVTTWTTIRVTDMFGRTTESPVDGIAEAGAHFVPFRAPATTPGILQIVMIAGSERRITEVPVIR